MTKGKDSKCCMGCTERELGCHDWCERFARRKARDAAIKAKKRESVEARAYLNNTYLDRKDEQAKRHKKKRHAAKA